MEEILGPIMFEIPGSAITGTVQITKDVVNKLAIAAVVPFSSVREKSA